ncbi:MAG: tRNA preQ1(34) S-adenosylmethionine ribosyltransferase-isomerase QueA [Polyangiaceae bacterium]|nr:tRNA preQ1(34) S-adenosylmethionine ribosyltransferase-isomerase QueA [Polyangiaceae bacterium]
MRTDELDYDLPEELIAQAPLPGRHDARLLVLSKGTGAVEHRRVLELPSMLRPCLFVVNDTRVLPARLRGTKPSGGRVELLLVERLTEEGTQERWLALGKASKGLPPGTRVSLSPGFEAEVVGAGDEGLEVALRAPGGVGAAIAAHGEMPLPPYIRRGVDETDAERYQTVFAARPGAVAAPTAGLHFSAELMRALEERGHRFAKVTLHVGVGTFRPVKAERLDEHPMHDERYEVSEEACRAIAHAKAEGMPVLAVGTTVVRALESAASEDGSIEAGTGRTRLFIRPSYRFRVIDALLTNFHLPRSTLLALVMALGGMDAVRAAYAEAVRERYRFFSYGDAMLIATEEMRL